MAPMTPRLKILSGKSPVPSACGFSLLDPYPPLPSLVQLQFPGRVPRSAWAYLERISSLARPFPPSPTLRCSHRRTTTFVFILFLFLVGERVGDNIACLSASASRHVGRL